MNSARSWLVFAGAVFAYLIGVTQRTSFGVATVDATERFHVNAAAVSTVAVLQIVVYAALQIPVGILVDRVGPKNLIVLGALIMAAGQTVLAFSPNLGVAIIGRVLVGMGDAATFVSVIRLLPNWFGGRLLPQLSQWVGVIGQLGQIVSAVPFALLLHAAGWQPALLVASGGSVVAAVVAGTLVRQGEPPLATGPIPTSGTFAQLRSTLARPGTQLGFWSHLVGGTVPTLMSIMWGYPFLTAGLGYDVPTAATVFSMLVVGNVVAGPIIGLLVARYPLRRSNLLLTVIVVIFSIWSVVLLWPGHPPLGLVVALFVAIGMGGPGSLIAFDMARTFNPSHALGSASGIVNVGGFLGGFICMLSIGVVLDAIDAARVASGAASELYALESFRIAFLVPFLIVGIGVVGMLRARRRTRRRMFEEEGIEIAPLWVALFRSRRRSRPLAPED
ncbi:MAG: MFS transporter [Actinomycetota bacterium]|nr:MFS transporter [Actinomycetota bacterium]